MGEQARNLLTQLMAGRPMRLFSFDQMQNPKIDLSLECEVSFFPTPLEANDHSLEPLLEPF